MQGGTVIINDCKTEARREQQPQLATRSLELTTD